MRVAGIRELRARTATLLGGAEPVLVTRHGKVAGVYVPLEEPDRLPDDLRRELAGVLGQHLARLLEVKGVDDAELEEDFRAHRRGRR